MKTTYAGVLRMEWMEPVQVDFYAPVDFHI